MEGDRSEGSEGKTRGHEMCGEMKKGRRDGQEEEDG